LRAEHHAVDKEGVLVTKELREAYRGVLGFEGIVSGDFAAGGKGATECGDPLDVAAELDLLGEEGIASSAIFGTLVGEVSFVLCREF
jgi:hypothetical protein